MRRPNPQLIGACPAYSVAGRAATSWSCTNIGDVRTGVRNAY